MEKEVEEGILEMNETTKSRKILKEHRWEIKNMYLLIKMDESQ
jgi:predicted transposase YdaD